MCWGWILGAFLWKHPPWKICIKFHSKKIHIICPNLIWSLSMWSKARRMAHVVLRAPASCHAPQIEGPQYNMITGKGCSWQWTRSWVPKPWGYVCLPCTAWMWWWMIREIWITEKRGRSDLDWLLCYPGKDQEGARRAQVHVSCHADMISPIYLKGSRMHRCFHFFITTVTSTAEW